MKWLGILLSLGLAISCAVNCVRLVIHMSDKAKEAYLFSNFARYTVSLFTGLLAWFWFCHLIK